MRPVLRGAPAIGEARVGDGWIAAEGVLAVEVALVGGGAAPAMGGCVRGWAVGSASVRMRASGAPTGTFPPELTRISSIRPASKTSISIAPFCD